MMKSENSGYVIVGVWYCWLSPCYLLDRSVCVFIIVLGSIKVFVSFFSDGI